MNSDVSTLVPYLNSNTDIHIYSLKDTDIEQFGFHFHISIATNYAAHHGLQHMWR
jgi:hypothetical protein